MSPPARRVPPRRIVIHADESCLGNGRAGANPGGAGGLVEVLRGSKVLRRDYYLSEADSTNNIMALRSAIAGIELVGAKGKPLVFHFVSDSEYLVNGMTKWMRAWIRRDWKNVKNVELWQELAEIAEPHDITWHWVRGHAKHPKNEYADFLATRAAREQLNSDGLVESGFADWLLAQREKGHYHDFEEDAL